MISDVLHRLSNKNSNAQHYSPITIGFLGDSVTNGCFEVYPVMSDHGEDGFDVIFDPEHGYPMQFRRILSMLYPKAQINIINVGISGDSAPNGFARMERDLLSYHPDLTVVCYGLNDCCGGINGIERYQDALVGIIRRLQEAGSEVILMTPQPICSCVHTQLRGEGLRDMANMLVSSFSAGIFDRYMQSARCAANETGAVLCDVYAKWMSMYHNGVDITGLLSNYLNHPTREMHQLFAWSLIDTLFQNAPNESKGKSS